MSCQKIRETVHPYIDHELDLAQAAEVESHCEQCEDCALVYRGQVALRSSLQDPSFYYRMPVDLKRRLASASRKRLAQSSQR